MKINELVLEYNLQNLLSLFQQKYLEQKSKDPSNKNDSLQDFMRAIEEPLRVQGKFQFIDPYMKWIAQRYVTGKLNKFEDIISKVIPGLLKYDALKRKNKLKPEHKDINKIKNINQFLDILDEYRGKESQSGKEKEREIERKFYETHEAELLYDDSEIKIVIPKSEKASCFFGRNTRWCTAATQGTNLFQNYNKEGNLYIILIKKENKRFQFHFESEQFMDEMDNPIKIFDLVEKYPKIWQIFSRVVKERNIKTPYFKPATQITMSDLVDLIKNGEISYIKNIVNQNPGLLNVDFLLEYIKNVIKPRDLLQFIKLGKFTKEDILDLLEKGDIFVFLKFFENTNGEYEDLLKRKNIFEKFRLDQILELLMLNDRILDKIDLDIVHDKIKNIDSVDHHTIDFIEEFLKQVKNLIKTKKGTALSKIIFYSIINLIDKNKISPEQINQNLMIEVMKILQENSESQKVIEWLFIKKPEIFDKFDLFVLKRYHDFIIKSFLEYKNILKNSNTIISFLLGNLPKKIISNMHVSYMLSILHENYIKRLISSEEILDYLRELINEGEKHLDLFDALLSFNYNVLHLSNLLLDRRIVKQFVEFLDNKTVLDKINPKGIQNFINAMKNRDRSMFDSLKDNMKNIRNKYSRLFV